MDVRKLMLMAGALVFAAICAMTARSMFSGSAGQPAQAAVAPEPTGPQVLVATKTLAPGTIIGADAVRYQTWPKDLVDGAYYIKGQQGAAVQGTVVRYTITAGQPVTQGALIKPGDRGFLAAALTPGMRAVSISVTAQASVAGFVFPGDRVDLLLTQTVSGGDQPLKATETIIRNLRVLATDQKTDKPADAEGKTQVTTFSNVTLEATPKIAEKIAVAQSVGTLSLSLRSIADDRMELEREIAAGEVNAPADAKAEKAMLMQIASQPIDTNPTVTTGGDVSRYQPSHVTPKTEAVATSAPASGPSASAAPRGPAVVVARGSNVTVTPLSAAAAAAPTGN
ncbi:MAG: Flp pilus assembly protein CpaB [Sphingomonas sp.]|nr:Flp pilus assembly protein CpaB [Sphingomonas sp.]